MEQDGNPEPRVLQKEPLDGVGQLRVLLRANTTVRIARPPDLSQPLAAAEVLLRALLVEAALVVEQDVVLLIPHADHLRRLFLQGHPA